MITSYYRSGTGESNHALSEAQIAAAIASGDGLLWVDIDASAGRDVGEPLLRDVFKFHHLTIDDCYNTLIDPPKVDDYAEYLFAIIHSIAYAPGDGALTASELDLYIGRNYVVSVHRAPQPAIDALRRLVEHAAPTADRGADFLAHGLFDLIVDDFHPVVDTLDDELEVIERAVLDDPRRETPEHIMRLKRSAQRLKRSILPQRDVANRFSRGEFSELISARSRMYFRDVYDHTVRVDEMIDSVRDRADSALTTYLSSVNNRINEVMKTLAIVTVIFLPLTLISGVYGTNFADTVPQYGWAPGFLVMMLVMAAAAAASLLWFRWRHWIG